MSMYYCINPVSTSTAHEFNFEDIMQQILMEQFLCGTDQRSPKRSPSPSEGLETNPAMVLSESLSHLSPRNSVSTLPSEEMQDKPSVNEKISVASMLETRASDEVFLKKQLRYLFSCYERVGTEERTYPKVRMSLIIIFLINVAR